MNDFTTPPDDFDSDYQQYNAKSESKRGRKRVHERPQLSSEAELCRSLWIKAVNDAQELRTGMPSNWNSCVPYDGGQDPKSGRTYRFPVWEKIAKEAHAAGFHVKELIDTVFRGWNEDRLPTPHTAVSADNMRLAVTERTQRSRRIADKLKNDYTIFKSNWWGAKLSIPDAQAAAAYVLKDTGLSLSPLFRYCVALLKNLPEVAKRWEDAARSEYFKDVPTYLEYWSSVLPAELVAEGKAFLAGSK